MSDFTSWLNGVRSASIRFPREPILRRLSGIGVFLGVCLLSAGSISAVKKAPASEYGELEQRQLGNVLVMEDDRVVPLYPIKRSGHGAKAVGYIDSGAQLTAVDETGLELWKRDKPEGSLFGGFDFDQDGWVDAAINRSETTGRKCGSQDIAYTWIEFVRGRDGALFRPIGKEISRCWEFPSATYPTHQWSGLGILFGVSPYLVAAPYYATSGSFLKFRGGEFVTEANFHYPSTPAYDVSYLNDKPNIYGQGHSYASNSHRANGLVLSVGGEERAVFFTSARVVQYKTAPLNPSQLVFDTPFVSGGRTDLAGRNYGLVMRDTNAPHLLVLIAGTSAKTVFNDMKQGKRTDDPWGGIERHVVVYRLNDGKIDDRFFSYAHDDDDGHQYENRIVYPNSVLPAPEQTNGSRLVFNVFREGHWYILITRPASITDEMTLKDRFLWDIRDLDGDGIEEWVISPARDPEDQDEAGSYFLEWRTTLYHWQESTKALEKRLDIPGAIPFLQETFRRPNHTSSEGYLYPVLNTFRDEGYHLLMLNKEKAMVLKSLALEKSDVTDEAK